MAHTTDKTSGLASPPLTGTPAPSAVFTSYQSRLLAKSNSGLLARSRSNSKDLSHLLGSPPSPRKLVSTPAAALALSGAKVGRGELGEKPSSHARSAKSVDLVRGQWEQRAAADVAADSSDITPGSSASTKLAYPVAGRRALWEHPPAGVAAGSPNVDSPTHRRSRSLIPATVARNVTSDGVASQQIRTSVASSIGLGKPPTVSSITTNEDPLQEIARQVSNSHSQRYPSTSDAAKIDKTASTISPNPTGSSVAASESSVANSASAPRKYQSAYMAQRAAKRSSASSGLVAQLTGESEAGPVTPRASRVRPSSLTSASRIQKIQAAQEDTSHLSTEERLAIARANAMKRLEAKQRTNAKVSDSELSPPATPPAVITPTVPSVIQDASSLPSQFLSPKVTNTGETPEISTPPAIVKSTYRSIVTPPSASVPPSGYTGLTSSSAEAGKYGSISRTDRRKLGRHLPRIVSGDGCDEDPTLAGASTAKQEMLAPPLAAPSFRPSSLSATQHSAPPGSIALSPGFRPSRFSASARLPGSAPRPPNSEVPKTPTRVSQTLTGDTTPTPVRRGSTHIGLNTPKVELDGAAMRGLMSAVGNSAARGAEVVDDEAVIGMYLSRGMAGWADIVLKGVKGRLRLSRLPLPASSAALAPAPLPSRRLMQNNNWMDRQRHALAAYEYLCHVGEAQQWIEGCLGEELAFGVTEMEEGLRDGVVLAKLAKVYEGDSVKIWTVSISLRFNIAE